MAEEKVRCVNKNRNDWGMFPKSLANAAWFQSCSGFFPEDLPQVTTTTAEAAPEKKRKTKNQP